jgi:hypothetical protein
LRVVFSWWMETMMKVCLLDGGANVRVWRRDAFCPSLAPSA